jgi:hypothetical protein
MQAYGVFDYIKPPFYSFLIGWNAGFDLLTALSLGSTLLRE